MVGYADGTTAYFDLKNESPLLKGTEDNIDIIYPYYDDRTQNMCIEGEPYINIYFRYTYCKSGLKRTLKINNYVIGYIRYCREANVVWSTH